MHVAIITAGGAGMFCGSCMHDNTWARSLMKAGAEVSLIPTYTPVRVDEENLSTQRVFFGGINVYLDHQSRIWRALPKWMKSWLDRPSVIRLATRFGVSNDAKQLGELTLAMLEGESGPHGQQVEELVEFICRDLKPDIVCFSNALLVGALKRLKERFNGPIFCTLQGDDIFLDSLAPTFRTRAIKAISERAAQFDGFLVHSDYYRDFMSDYLSLPRDRFHRLPLGIDLIGHDGVPEKSGLAAQSTTNGSVTIGYFARICPEKGLHVLVDAFREVRKRYPEVRLVVGGYLGKRDEQYFADLMKSTTDFGEAFQYAGSPPDHASKVELLKSFDVLCVPAPYREPKGIYVLEALANGVPVVEPAHGAFRELVSSTDGGLLYPPDDVGELVRCLETLVVDRDQRIELGRRGQEAVRMLYSPEAMAARTLQIFSESLSTKHAATSSRT